MWYESRRPIDSEAKASYYSIHIIILNWRDLLCCENRRERRWNKSQMKSHRVHHSRQHLAIRYSPFVLNRFKWKRYGKQFYFFFLKICLLSSFACGLWCRMNFCVEAGLFFLLHSKPHIEHTSFQVWIWVSPLIYSNVGPFFVCLFNWIGFWIQWMWMPRGDFTTSPLIPNVPLVEHCFSFV